MKYPFMALTQHQRAILGILANTEVAYPLSTLARALAIHHTEAAQAMAVLRGRSLVRAEAAADIERGPVYRATKVGRDEQATWLAAKTRVVR